MANKTLNTRIQHKTDTSANWAQAENFSPLKGELIIYQEENENNSKIKIGDGNTNVNDLPFIAEQVQSDWNESIETSDAFIKNKPPIKNGTGENAVVIGTGSAVSAYSISEGVMTQAGSRAFSIIGYEYSRGGLSGYLLDSAEGLEVGDVYSAHICYTDSDGTVKSQQCINYGKITHIEGPVNKSDYEYNSGYYLEGAESGYVVSVDKLFLIDKELTIPDSFIDDNGIDNEKSTFRILQKPNIGTRLIGEYTHTEGIDTIAMSKGGHAEGRDTRAEGSYGHAEGRNTKAWYCAHAEGKNTIASGENSHAEGVNTLASLHAAHAEGSGSSAISYCTHAEGRDTTASNDSAHAEGNLTIASGKNSHAEGKSTKASGSSSHAEGSGTTASGAFSHAEGENTTALGVNSHAEGYNNVASGKISHAEGYNNIVSGQGSHVEGIGNEATFGGSHAEGSGTHAINWNAHTEGKNTTASGDSAHAEGQNTTASGQSAHAEGENTIASNRGTHAEGVGTQAKQGGAHSEGNSTQALEWNSHSEGKGTIANGYEQHVQGRYNVKDNEGIYAHIVGNGSSDRKRSNAHTLDWDGNAEFQGDVKANVCGGEKPISLIDIAKRLQLLETLLANMSYDAENNTYIFNANITTEGSISEGAPNEEELNVLSLLSLTKNENGEATYTFNANVVVNGDLTEKD